MMSNPYRGKGVFACTGFTLIDLMVAVGLTSILVTIVYATWNRINLHTSTYQRREALRGESNRIAEMITGELRRCEAVIRWDQSSVRFVSSATHDTVTYSYNGQTLEVNGEPLTPVVYGTSVSAFSLENRNGDDASLPFLFRITVSLSNAHGESDTVSTTVMARRLNEQPPDNDFLW